jgi:hypothetical protein
MLSQLSFLFDAARWESWIIPIAGALCTGLALVVGWTLLRQRRAPEAKENAPTAGTAEQRKASRRLVCGVEVRIVDAQPPVESVVGWVMDRSAGGLGLSVDKAVSVGTILRLLPCQAPAGTACLEVRVKRCQREDCRWTLGCRFVQVPSAEVQKYLG